MTSQEVTLGSRPFDYYIQVQFSGSGMEILRHHAEAPRDFGLNEWLITNDSVWMVSEKYIREAKAEDLPFNVVVLEGTPLSDEHFDFFVFRDGPPIVIDRPTPDTRAVLRLLFQNRTQDAGLSWDEIRESFPQGFNQQRIREVFGANRGRNQQVFDRLILSTGKGKATRFKFNHEACPFQLPLMKK